MKILIQNSNPGRQYSPIPEANAEGARGHVNDTHRKGRKPGPKKPGPQGRKPRKTFKKAKQK